MGWQIWHLGGGQGAEVSLADFRKDIRMELQNEAGQLVMAFNVFRCWPSEYVAMGPLDAHDDASVAIESLTLQHEGWLRDPDVAEPKEPSFNVPLSCPASGFSCFFEHSRWTSSKLDGTSS